MDGWMSTTTLCIASLMPLLAAIPAGSEPVLSRHWLEKARDSRELVVLVYLTLHARSDSTSHVIVIATAQILCCNTFACCVFC